MSQRQVRMTSTFVDTVGTPAAERSFLCTRTYTLEAADAERFVTQRKAIFVDDGPAIAKKAAKKKTTRTTPPGVEPEKPAASEQSPQ